MKTLKYFAFTAFLYFTVFPLSLFIVRMIYGDLFVPSTMAYFIPYCSGMAHMLILERAGRG